MEANALLANLGLNCDALEAIDNRWSNRWSQVKLNSDMERALFQWYVSILSQWLSILKVRCEANVVMTIHS